MTKMRIFSARINTNILQASAIFSDFLSQGAEQSPKGGCQWVGWPPHMGGRYRSHWSIWRCYGEKEG